MQRICTHLSVLAQVSPHAGSVTSPHQDVVDEEICARYGADELARSAIIVVAEVGDHVVELEDLIALVRVLQSRVESHPWVRVVCNRADSSIISQTQDPVSAPVLPVPRGPHRTRGPWLPWWPRRSGFAWPARLPLWPLEERGGWRHVAVVGQSLGLGLHRRASAGDACGGALVLVRVAHHSTGAQHLVVAVVIAHGADQHRDEHHKHQHQHDPYSSRHQGLPAQAEAREWLGSQRGSAGSRNGDCWSREDRREREKETEGCRGVPGVRRQALGSQTCRGACEGERDPHAHSLTRFPSSVHAWFAKLAHWIRWAGWKELSYRSHIRSISLTRIQLSHMHAHTCERAHTRSQKVDPIV